MEGVSQPLPATGNRTIATLYKACACSAIGLALLMVAGIWHLGANSMIACGFLGAAFIHFSSRPSLNEIFTTLAAGMVAGALYLLLKGPVGADAFTRSMGLGAFLGIGSIAILSFEMVARERRDRARFLADALVLPVFSLVAGIGMQLTNHAAHPSYDYLVYGFESSLGIFPGAAVVRLFHRMPWTQTGAELVYAGLLIFPTLYHAWALWRGRAEKNNLMHRFVIAGLCGFLFYQICPAMGPLYAFSSQFPDHLPASVPLQPFSSTGVNNAMPSMHMSWALLVWFAAWELGAAAIALATLVVGFTGLATLGFGEHYLIDLIVAAPVVMATVGIYRRNVALGAAGVALAAGWTAYLRSGAWTHVAPWIHWTVIVATLSAAAAITRVSRNR
ncbi:MAG: phosphatase PAP2 family protein [Acidobacteriia bacterium]|nr:phosphatase PAP2 family protein [Terriglobia bacterium]